MYEMSATNVAISHEHGFSGLLRKSAGAEWFARSILIAIGLTGILSGVETYPLFRGGGPLALAVEWAQYAILIIFVVEIAVKIGASGSRPWCYFKNGWNIFDFSIVVVSLLPMDAEYLVVLRLARVLRLFTALEDYRFLSPRCYGDPSLGYVGLLLLLHFYIYSSSGPSPSATRSPPLWLLHRSMLTLFQVLTLEGWNDILATEYLGSDVGYDDPWKQLQRPATASRLRTR
jgi:voltage-gated sodium channel